MLALGTKGQLGCPDIEWNAINGLINYNQAAGLLWRVPGCALTKYAFLVALSAQGAINCSDVDWHWAVGLISDQQAGWLRAVLASQGRGCVSPPPGTPAFGDGAHLVGIQIAPGRYVAQVGPSCYWKRTRGLSGSVSEIIANNIPGAGQAIVDIAPTDVTFVSESCGTWVPYSPTGPASSFGTGDYVVGGQIAPGIYQSTGSSTNCYWKRMSGFSDSLSEILANYLSTSPTFVQILPTDVGFNSSRCGSWVRIA